MKQLFAHTARFIAHLALAIIVTTAAGWAESACMETECLEHKLAEAHHDAGHAEPCCAPLQGTALQLAPCTTPEDAPEHEGHCGDSESHCATLGACCTILAEAPIANTLLPHNLTPNQYAAMDTQHPVRQYLPVLCNPPR